MKKLVTHLNPHLDDIVGFWLFVRYVPGFKNAKLEFEIKDAHEKLRKNIDADKNKIYIGTGMGKFDEHKGNLNDCAASLVWKYIKKSGFAPKDPYARGAVDKLVEYTFLEDTAKIETADYHQFMLSGILAGYLKNSEDSLATSELAFIMLDSLLTVLYGSVRAEKDFAKHIAFKTPWGKGAAFYSSGKETARLAYKKGFVLTVSIHKDKNYRVIGAQSNSKVNLTRAYEKAVKLEPSADWFLHHSKRLLICGSDVAANKHLSKLSLKQLIGLVT